MRARFTPVLAAGFLFLAANLTLGNLAILQAQSTGLQKINHVVVIYQENWSFDSLYGRFPGANGIDNAGPAARQVDKNGEPYATLPQPLNTTFSPAVPDPRFPADLPNEPPRRDPGVVYLDLQRNDDLLTANAADLEHMIHSAAGE